MIHGLERFVGELRRAGIGVSPAEWLDGVRALERVGLEDRERLRDALRAALVKHRPQQQLFDDTFDRFFTAPGRGKPRRGRRRGAAAAVPANPAGSPARRRPHEPARGDGRPPTPQAEGQGREPARERTQTLRCQLEALRNRSLSRLGRLRHLELGGGGRQAERNEAPVVSRRSLRGRMTVDEESTLAREVPRLVRRLRLGAGRRQRGSRRGSLYLRRVFRDNVRHGGVPWVLPRRVRRPRRPKVVLLIDVSWSSARAAGLFLSLAAEFLQRLSRTQAFLFVDRPIDATAAVGDWSRARSQMRDVPTPRTGRPRPGSGIRRAGASFAELLESLPGLNLDAPSDHGRTFHRLLDVSGRLGGRDAVLLVLGDGRNNRLDPEAWTFEAVTERFGAVIWLVPEPLAEWGTGDSALRDYLPWVDVAVEAKDLDGLSRGVAALLHRL